MSKGKEVTVETEVVTGKKISPWFNPRHVSILDKDYMLSFIKEWGGVVEEGIKLELAPKQVNFKVALENEGVYFSILVIALGAHLPLSLFVKKVLAFYRFAPTQLSPGSWRVILGFGALCDLYQLEYWVDEFRSLYRQVFGKEGSYYFSPRRGKKKLITDVPDSDSGWQTAIVLVQGPWKATDP